MPSETNSNFGMNLPWWGRLFGTYRDQRVHGHEATTLLQPVSSLLPDRAAKEPESLEACAGLDLLAIQNTVPRLAQGLFGIGDDRFSMRDEDSLEIPRENT